MVLWITVFFATPVSAAIDASSPATRVKLVFIHHSTGGNWLADVEPGQPYGGLGAALTANNYYASATNYGWGPYSVGDRTDIINWPEWFTGPNASAITAALYAETDQNIGGFGDWARPATDPGGENRIVMFKSCFPNSDLFGDPDDAAGSVPNDQYTVSNAKAVYNDLLSYFQTRPDKLFVVITAPPLMENEYNPDYQSAAHRAANARAFNNWLVNDWLDDYSRTNVAVFDYFNVLTGPSNHHRINGGAVEHVTPGGSNFAYYPSGDSHPNAAGHQKATAEFVPMLNYYYQRWQAGMGDDDGDDSDDEGDDDGDNDGTDPGDDDPGPIDDGGAGDDNSGNGNGAGDDDDQTPPSCLSVSDFRYKGAFRLPGDDDSGWGYGGGAMAWYPYGDPGGRSDGHPGSLFAAGYNVENRIAEISIPAPVISASKNPADLNTAALLQGFADLKGSLSRVLDTPPQYAGIAWLPAMGDQADGKLYLAFGQHFQEFEASHLWCNVNLSAPDIAGPWQFGGYANYVTNDYLLPIPESFADTYLFGRRLGSGRHREGVWGGLGPTLFAAAPWQDGNPPDESTNLSTVEPLLLYGEQIPGIPEMQIDETRKMDGYSEADYWSGAAWLTAGSKSAVAFIGTKAMGESWYGFANGVVWDYDCAASGTCPDVPDWPYDGRGYWADDYQARIILYDPADMAAVARGTRQTWEPQPYVVIDLTSRLFDPDIDVTRYRRHLVGAMAFDDVNGFLYFFELLADGDKPVVHVFELDASSPPDDGNGDDDGSGDDTDDSDGTDPGDDGDDDVHAGSGGGSGGGCFIHAVW